MSIRKIIHNAIETKLKTFNPKWIDVWKAQVGKKESYPFNFPAFFISTKRIAWGDMTLDVKEGNVQIEIWLFFNKYADTFEGAEDQNSSFDDIETVENITDALQWTEGEPFSEMTLIVEEDLSGAYERPAFKLTFETIVYKKIIK